MSLPAAPAKLPLSKIRPKLQQAVLKTSHIFFRISLTLESGPLDLDIEPIWHICVRQAQLADPRQSKTPAHFGGVNSCPCSLLLNGASGGQESNLHTPETANKPNILSTVLKTGEGDTHIYVFTCVYAIIGLRQNGPPNSLFSSTRSTVLKNLLWRPLWIVRQGPPRESVHLPPLTGSQHCKQPGETTQERSNGPSHLYHYRVRTFRSLGLFWAGFHLQGVRWSIVTI